MGSQPYLETDDKWILHKVDYLSDCSHIRCFKPKYSKLTAHVLGKIISSYVDPKILQFDNGSEFLGEYVAGAIDFVLFNHFLNIRKNIRIIKKLLWRY